MIEKLILAPSIGKLAGSICFGSDKEVKMRRPLVAGNWKMNGTRDSVALLIAGIKEKLSDVQGVDVAVCPPFVYLDQISKAVDGTDVAVGGQDMSIHTSGAYTGEISAAMLLEMGAKAVILGHSERRTYHGETSEQVAEKSKAAVAAGLLPIVCVGETLDERESDQTEKVIAEQLDVFFRDEAGRKALAASVIAYEPVWAIGTGKTATPEQAQEVHAFIRERIAGHDAAMAGQMRVLYGGSVKPDNAEELFSMADIDGGLIGGASLKAEDFLAICTAANK